MCLSWFYFGFVSVFFIAATMFPQDGGNSFWRIPMKISGGKVGSAHRGKGIFYNICMRQWFSGHLFIFTVS